MGLFEIPFSVILTLSTFASLSVNSAKGKDLISVEILRPEPALSKANVAPE